MTKILIICLLLVGLYAEDKVYKEQDWGVGLVIRTGTIPYDTSGLNSKSTVSSLVPMLFFENEYFFMKGIESGIKLYNSEDFELNAITRVRYVNIPADLQNAVQADSNDLGAQLRYNLNKSNSLDFEVMSDLDGRYFGNLNYSYKDETTSLDYKAYANLQINSSEYNSHYYGFKQERLKGDVAPTLGVSAKYHVTSNFYLIGRAQTTLLGSEAKKSSFIDKNLESEVYAGIGFFNDKTKKKKEKLGLTPYIRIAHGWATPSNIADIISFQTEKDPYKNQMTSIFYGYPLTDELFSLPIDIYITPGFAHHHHSEVQNATQEYILAIKGYYTFSLPWRVRFGVAEGISYVNEVTYIEKTEMERKGYEPSNLLNYLDFTLDVHLGDIFGKDLNKWWLGYEIHHRSAIFETSSRYGRIKGGLNINAVYLQWHF